MSNPRGFFMGMQDLLSYNRLGSTDKLQTDARGSHHKNTDRAVAACKNKALFCWELWELNINIYNQDEVGHWVRQLIDEDNLHAFYTSSVWLNLRDEVLDDFKRECLACKKKGKYTKATIVHHVKFIKEYPELALSKTYIDEDGKERVQLKPVCRECHEYVEHPERLRWNKKEPLTEERW